MGGGLMQLMACGAQDIYLTGNPQITFFKVVYRRHTNFSIEAILQTFKGNPSVSGSTITSTISRNGDLVTRLWLDVGIDRNDLKAATRYANWTNNTGHAFVKECEIKIGDQLIDRHYSQWLDVWNELTDHDESEWQGLNKHASKNSYLKSGSNTNSGEKVNRLYIPLQFWFCRNPGLALPLIALQYHGVDIKIVTRGYAGLVNGGGQVDFPSVTQPDVKLWADYIYLDTDERRRFAKVSHEYLIEQVQLREPTTMSSSQDLEFNHPVKELIWTVQSTNAATEGESGDNDMDATLNKATLNASSFKKNDYFNYSAGSGGSLEIINGVESREGFSTMKLIINGDDRFKERNATYFRTCQPIQAGHKVPSKHIYCYSFALKPEEHQPSGTCNFSRIDYAKMIFTGGDIVNTNLTIWAVNYNVLRIMSGLCGLVYSN
jgi:hypothetical protein